MPQQPQWPRPGVTGHHQQAPGGMGGRRGGGGGGDDADRKLFVGGLSPLTTGYSLQAYFMQYGEIVECKVIMDKYTGNSKGFGFVTFKTTQEAQRALADPFPVVDGKRANSNLASVGRATIPPRKRQASHQGQFGQYGQPGKRQRTGYMQSSTPVVAESYVERLRAQGITLTIESATQQIEGLRAQNPCDALKYFLELSDLFRDTPSYDPLHNKLLEEASAIRKSQIEEAQTAGTLENGINEHGEISDAPTGQGNFPSTVEV